MKNKLLLRILILGCSHVFIIPFSGEEATNPPGDSTDQNNLDGSNGNLNPDDSSQEIAEGTSDGNSKEVILPILILRLNHDNIWEVWSHCPLKEAREQGAVSLGPKL